MYFFGFTKYVDFVLFFFYFSVAVCSKEGNVNYLDGGKSNKKWINRILFKRKYFKMHNFEEFTKECMLKGFFINCLHVSWHEVKNVNNVIMRILESLNMKNPKFLMLLTREKKKLFWL